MNRAGYLKWLILILLVLLQVSGFAQDVDSDSLNTDWAISLAGYYYFIPEDVNTGMFIGTADHKSLHLETRYNYEGHKTASVFAGWRFSKSGSVDFTAVPMVGLIGGNTVGAAPGLELSLIYKKFDAYAEAEYVVDFSGSENNYFYVWSEAAVTPIEPLRTGIIFQRTRLYTNDLDIQRGVFANVSFWKLVGGVYYLNPFSSSNVVITMLRFEF